MSSKDWKQLFTLARTSQQNGDRKSAASAFAKLASLSMIHRHWARAAFFLSRAHHFLPDSAKILLAQAICEWERRREREARHKIQSLARSVLRKKRLEEYAGVIERELANYSEMRQLFYECIVAVERNSALPFLGLSRLYLRNDDWPSALRFLSDAVRTGDRVSEVLQAIRGVATQYGLAELSVQCGRFETGELRRDDFCLLLGQRSSPRSEAPGEGEGLELGQMIHQLEAELGDEAPPDWDKVGPLLSEFRRRAHPIIGSHSKSRIDLALAFFEMKLFSAAKDELKHIGEDDPLAGQAMCLLGQILYEEGGWLGAMEVYQKCLREERFRGTAHDEAEYQLIRVYVKLEDYGKAMIHIRELDRRSPDYRDLKRLKQTVADRLGVEQLPEVRRTKGLRKTG